MGIENGITLITGASGFIGANLCRRLVEMGAEAHALVRPGSDTWRLEGLGDSLKIHRVDITDIAAVREAIATIRPTIIYHLATHGAYSFQDNGSKILLTNIFGLWNVLNTCNEAGYELFVNTGSSSEYGSKRYAMRETDLPEPNSYYAVAKAGQSLLCNYISRIQERKLPIVTFRPFSVYGPWEEPSRLIPQLIYAALEDRPINMVSPETSRDFVYVDDVVDAYLMVDRLKEQPGEIFNIGSGVQSSLKEIIETAGAVFGRPVKARWNSMKSRTWDTDVWVADISKTRRLIGWQPKTLLGEGLEKCKDWFGANAELYRNRTGG